MITNKLVTGCKVIFFIIFILLATASIFFGDDLGKFEIATQIFSIVGFAAPALYSSFNVITVNVNKWILNIFNTDVSWSSGIKFEIDFTSGLADAAMLKNKIIELLNNEYTIQKIENNKYITLKKKSGSNKKLRLKLDIVTNFDDEEYSVKLTHDTETTYRNSKKEISTIIDIYNVVRDTLSIKNTIYSATIAFEKINPFYKLTIKNLSEEEVNFNLKFKPTDKTKISIYNKKMEINSISENEIREILSKYITTIFS